MKTFRITVPVTEVHGEQVFQVDARTAAEALRKWKKKGGMLVEETVEVIELDVDGLTVNDVLEVFGEEIVTGEIAPCQP